MEEYEREVALIDYIEVLIKRKRLIIGGTLLCALITWFFATSGSQVYEAKTLIAVSPAIASAGQAGSQESVQGAPGAEIVVPGLAAETYQELATGDELVSSLRDSLLRLDLAAKTMEHVSATSIAGAAGMLSAELLEKTMMGKSPLLAFRVQSVVDELPVAVVNTWANMFVQRHRGMSSNVADDYYQWVQSQYNTAKEQLEHSEDKLRQIKAAYNNLNVLGVEVGMKSERLESSLKEYQVTKMGLETTRQELAYLQERMTAVELAGEWLGYASNGAILQAKGSMEKMPAVRISLIEALIDLDQVESDSLNLATRHENERQRHLAARKRKLLTLERDTSLSRIGQEVSYLETLLSGFRGEEAKIDQRLKQLQIEIDVKTRNRDLEPRVQTVSKAITDEALWQEVIRGGKVDERAQANLSKFRLVDEELNPIHGELSAAIRRHQVEFDQAQLQRAFVQQQIPEIEERLLARHAALDALAVQERALQQELNRERLESERSIAKEASPLQSRIDRKRQAVVGYADEYSRMKQRVEELQRQLITLESQLGFEQQSFEGWSAQIRETEAETDSLQLVQTRLERDLSVFRSTFAKFANLVEEARISRQQAASDIQVVSRAVVARPVAREAGKKATMGAVVGLLASVMLAFLIEYVGRPRRNGQGTHPA